MPHNSETIMSTLDTLKPGQQGAQVSERRPSSQLPEIGWAQLN